MNEDYRSRLYHDYIKTHFGFIRDISIEALEGYRVFFKHYFGRFLPKDKRARILDVGCGYGAFLYFLRKEGYQDVYGVDISPEQVEAAKRLGLEGVYCGDLRTFLEEHNNIKEFGCITALDLVEHFPKQEVLPFLEMVYGALKPNGTFIMQGPNAESPFFGAIRYADFTHEMAFTRESVSQILRHVGFANIKVCSTGPVVHGLLSAARWIIWQGVRLLLTLYLAAETGVLRGHILTQNLIAVAQKPGEKVC